ncbi:MAG TPA: MBL fold metallo-hydrolase [Terriglobia bacterium]|nr:MBL fold metallo-hydrolase [Terriglobia bacterium]
MDRRQFVKGAFGGLTTLLVSRRLAISQQSLDGRVTVVTDVGTNVVVLTTTDGLVLVDSGSPQFVNALMKELGAKRVQTVFNTHYHLDNTGANESFAPTGAKIIAHESTREWMETPYWIPSEDRYQKARPKSAQPTETFYTSGSLKAGAEQIDYGYLLEAHTSGDIYVFFRNSNVLAVGDVASPSRDPELDYFTGAWIGGRVDAMDKLLKLSDDKTRIIPGYGPTMSRAELKAERDLMSTIYDRTVDRVREGDSAEDMLKAGVMKDLPRAFKNPGKFLYDVHKGLWAHHNKLAPNVV